MRIPHLPAQMWTADNGRAALSAYRDLMREAFFEHPDSMPKVILRRAQQDTWAYNGGVDNPKPIPLQQMSTAQAMMVLSPLGTEWDATQRTPGDSHGPRRFLVFQTGRIRCSPHRGK